MKLLHLLGRHKTCSPITCQKAADECNKLESEHRMKDVRISSYVMCLMENGSCEWSYNDSVDGAVEAMEMAQQIAGDVGCKVDIKLISGRAYVVNMDHPDPMPMLWRWDGTENPAYHEWWVRNKPAETDFEF